MGEVIHLDLPIADDAVLDADMVLEGNKGKFQQLVICGYDQGGGIAICATHGSREVLWILNRAIVHLMLETE